MVTDNHYRWDFVGLSTDEKPTPETSYKVVDGSTFYCSNNSKLYVWCRNQWYERKALGGGGGGGGGGVTDYDDLDNRPQINSVTLTGDLSSSELGLQPALVSGTSIKTINGASILASGNLALKPEIPVVSTPETTLAIDPNKFYSFGEVGSLTLTLNTPADATIYNEYMFEFDSGTTPTSLTLPNTVKWQETPTIEASKTYQCSIVNNIGILLGV